MNLNAFELITTEICYLLEFLITFVLVCGFLHQLQKKYYFRFLCFCIPLSLANTLTELAPLRQPSILCINLLILGLLIWFVFRCRLIQTLLLSVLVFSTSMSVQLLLVLIFSHLPFSLPVQAILANICTLVICLLLVLLCPIHRLLDLLMSKSHLLLIGVLNLTGVLLMMNLYNKVFHTSFGDLILSFLFPIVVLFLINIVFFREYLIDQKKLEEAESYRNYLPLIEEMIDQVRARQHKFDNEIQAIRLLPATYQNYDSLRDALTEYSEFLITECHDSSLLKLNTKCLAAFLYHKLHNAELQNKNIHLTIHNTMLVSVVPEYELINMLGILVDNMIEAVSENDTADLILDSRDNHISFTTINPGPLMTPELRSAFFEKGYSTKTATGKRGYGLYLLKESVDEYRGRIYLENISSNDRLCIRIEIQV